MGQPFDERISLRFERLASSLWKRYGSVSRAAERFEVSWMVYDESRKALVTCEAIISGENQMQRAMGSFSLPYGLGLAGTAFKECDKIHLFKRVKDVDPHRPSPYVPRPETDMHEVLLSVPMEHRDIWQLPSEDPLFFKLDRPRVCFGVVNIGTTSNDSRLSQALTSQETLRLRARVQSFASRLLRNIY